MGAVPGGASREDASNWVDCIDLGPQQEAKGYAVGSVFSLESTLLQNRFVRHRDFELWADERQSSKLFQKDASFRLEAGLVGHGSSLRAGNLPVYYVRHKDSKLFIDEYDGDGLMRADASFELRQPAAKADVVCVCSVNYPGKYLFCEEDGGRIVLATFVPCSPEPFYFRLVPGLALDHCPDFGAPLFTELGTPELNASLFVEEHKAKVPVGESRRGDNAASEPAPCKSPPEPTPLAPQKPAPRVEEASEFSRATDGLNAAQASATSNGVSATGWSMCPPPVSSNVGLGGHGGAPVPPEVDAVSDDSDDFEAVD